MILETIINLLDTQKYISAPILIVLGFFTCFFGYKIFRLTLFFTGFILGGIAGYLMGKTTLHLEYWILFVIIGGLTIGILGMFFHKFFSYIIGAILASFISSLIAYNKYPDKILLFFFIGLILGLVISILLYKFIVIVQTSSVGAFLISFASFKLIFTDKFKEFVTILLVVTLIFTVLGILFQYKFLKPQLIPEELEEEE